MSYADKGAATVMTFSIFLCGCKLSGNLMFSNLSTLSAAKLQKSTIGACPLLYFFLFDPGGVVDFGLGGIVVLGLYIGDIDVIGAV